MDVLRVKEGFFSKPNCLLVVSHTNILGLLIANLLTALKADMFILFLFKIVRKQARKIHCTEVQEVQVSMFLQQLSLCFTCPVAVLYLNSGLADSLFDFYSNFLIQIEQAVFFFTAYCTRYKVF